MIRSLNKLQPWGILLLRLALGASMMDHGFQKIIPPGGLHGSHPLAGLDHFSLYVVSLGLPHWLGYVSVLTEFVGGMFLLAGLLARPTALLVAGNMIVALVTVNVYKGYAGSECTLALISMALLLVLTGSGALGLDQRLGIS